MTTDRITAITPMRIRTITIIMGTGTSGRMIPGAMHRIESWMDSDYESYYDSYSYDSDAEYEDFEDSSYYTPYEYSDDNNDSWDDDSWDSGWDSNDSWDSGYDDWGSDW